VILVAVTVAAGVALGWLRGGRLHNLGRVRLRAVPLLAVAVVVQVLLAGGAGSVLAVARMLLVVAAAAVLSFMWANRGLPGMVLIALGAGANAVVMIANAAMPVSRRALQVLGQGAAPLTAGRHVLAGSIDGGARLLWLGDVLPVPLLGSVVSPGDVAIAVGVGVLLPALMCRRPRVVGGRRPDPRSAR